MLASNIGYNKAWNLKREKLTGFAAQVGLKHPRPKTACQHRFQSGVKWRPCQDVKSIPCLHWNMIVGKSDKILALNQAGLLDHCHCCTTSFKVPTLQCAGVWFTTPAMGGAKAGRSSGTFGNPTSDSPNFSCLDRSIHSDQHKNKVKLKSAKSRSIPLCFKFRLSCFGSPFLMLNLYSSISLQSASKSWIHLPKNLGSSDQVTVISKMGWSVHHDSTSSLNQTVTQPVSNPTKPLQNRQNHRFLMENS